MASGRIKPGTDAHKHLSSVQALGDEYTALVDRISALPKSRSFGTPIPRKGKRTDPVAWAKSTANFFLPFAISNPQMAGHLREITRVLTKRAGTRGALSPQSEAALLRSIDGVRTSLTSQGLKPAEVDRHLEAFLSMGNQ